MNLLCPNCQKMLTVPEQYAGQLMKCPLCAGTFTVPNMPGGGLDPVPAFPGPAQGSPPPADVYAVHNDPEPAPAFPNPVPAFHPAPAFDPIPPGPPVPEPAFVSSPPSPAPTYQQPQPQQPPPGPGGPGLPSYSAPTTIPQAGYTRSCSMPFNPAILRWVPPAALLLVFVLQFFPWVGIYPGGVAEVTQSAWGAAFGGYSEDPDMRKKFRTYPTDEQLEKENSERRDKDKQVEDPRPGVSLLTLFYLLLFIPTLLLALGSVVLVFLKQPLPPVVQQLLPWQWSIHAGLNAVLLLFLVLQLLLNFSLENNFKAYADSRIPQKKDGLTTEERKFAEARRGMALQGLHRTNWLRMAVFLHLVAAVSAGLVMWVDKRGPSHPVPKLEMVW